MTQAPKTPELDDHDCADIVIPHAGEMKPSLSSRMFARFQLSPLHAVLIAVIGSISLIAFSGRGMSVEAVFWVVLAFTGVACSPLLERMKSQIRVMVFALYAALVLSHAFAFGWPLDLFTAQVVIGCLGIIFMLSFRGSEMVVAALIGSAFFFGMLLDRQDDYSIAGFGIPLLIGSLVGATVAAIGTAIRRERGSRQKYQYFVDSAPLPMWEVDLTGIRDLVASVRSQGVSDFCFHLEENEELLQETWNRLKVLEANPVGRALLTNVGPYSDPMSVADEPFGRALVIALLKVFWGEGRADEVAVSFGEGLSAQHYRFNAHAVGPAGDLSRVAVIASDVSEDKNHGVELERQIVNRERFVASIAHEIRTPLSTVIGLAQSILETPEMDASERSELLDLMIMDGQDLAGIVEDLLVGARLDMGTLKIVLQDVAVKNEVDAVLAALGMRAEVEVKPGVVVIGNRIRFRQVVRNMLTNASRYGGSEVRIVYGSKGGFGSLEVRDNGAPVPVEDREKMFEAYERLHDHPGVTDSVGLGLPVSRSLARAMGGDLEYDHDGREAIFRVTLPVAKTSRVAIGVGTAV